MKVKMHFQSRMFLSNPYVVRIKHPGSTHVDMKLNDFIKYRTIAKKQVTATWGYSDPVFEVVKSVHEPAISLLGHNLFGPNAAFIVPIEECHSYWVFTDESDALQFRLSAGESVHMHMWPSKIKFTIYEYDTN